MSRIATASLALALAFGGVASASAQQGRQPRPHAEAGARAERRGGGPLFEGIELTAEQKAQVDAIFEKHRSQARAHRGEPGTRGEERSDRPRPEGEARRRGPGAGGEGWQARRQAMVAELRAVLTPEQQAKFDSNVARLREAGPPGPRAGARGGFERGGVQGGGLERLGLDEQQRTRIAGIREKYRPTLEAERQKTRPIFERLREARRSGDEAAATRARDELKQARERTRPTHERMLAEIRAVLTPEQQQRLDEQRKRFEERGHSPRRRGGRAGTSLGVRA